MTEEKNVLGKERAIFAICRSRVGDLAARKQHKHTHCKCVCLVRGVMRGIYKITSPKTSFILF